MKYKELMEKIQNALRDEKPSVNHSYAQATALRIPKKLLKQPPASKATMGKTDVVTKDWSKEVKQTDDCSSHIESNLPGAHLIPARVHRWNIKNYASSERKKQMQVRNEQKELSDKISVLSSEDTVKKNEKKQDELLLDMMKRREERHYRIERPLS